jgi:hypothetical protein
VITTCHHGSAGYGCGFAESKAPMIFRAATLADAASDEVSSPKRPTTIAAVTAASVLVPLREPSEVCAIPWRAGVRLVLRRGMKAAAGWSNQALSTATRDVFQRTDFRGALPQHRLGDERGNQCHISERFFLRSGWAQCFAVPVCILERYRR